MRIKAVIAYDGSAFYGFQRQTTTHQTVTGILEKTLRSLQIESAVTGSGRTDRGVHATGQVIHFDVPPFWERDLAKLKTLLNRKLEAIRFRTLTRTYPTFHARFDAKRRLYRYIFKTTFPTVFERNYISYFPSYDQKRLREALTHFEGEHDFRYFHKSGSQPHSTIRTIYNARSYQIRDLHCITFEANGFLRSQVRMMTQAAMLYAQGLCDIETLKEQLESKKQHLHTLAPASGLYLAKIHYPFTKE